MRKASKFAGHGPMNSELNMPSWEEREPYIGQWVLYKHGHVYDADEDLSVLTSRHTDEFRVTGDDDDVLVLDKVLDPKFSYYPSAWSETTHEAFMNMPPVSEEGGYSE